MAWPADGRSVAEPGEEVYTFGWSRLSQHRGTLRSMDDPKYIDPLCIGGTHSFMTQCHYCWMLKQARAQADAVATASAAQGQPIVAGAYDQLLDRCIDEQIRRGQE